MQDLQVTGVGVGSLWIRADAHAHAQHSPARIPHAALALCAFNTGQDFRKQSPSYISILSSFFLDLGTWMLSARGLRCIEHLRFWC